MNEIKQENGTSSELLPNLTIKEKEFWFIHNDRSLWRPPTFKTITRLMGLVDTKSIVNYKKQILKKGYNI